MATHSFVLAWRIPWAEMPDAWQATVYGVTKSQTQLSDTHTHTHTHPPPSLNISLVCQLFCICHGPGLSCAKLWLWVHHLPPASLLGPLL